MSRTDHQNCIDFLPACGRPRSGGLASHHVPAPRPRDATAARHPLRGNRCAAAFLPDKLARRLGYRGMLPSSRYILVMLFGYKAITSGNRRMAMQTELIGHRIKLQHLKIVTAVAEWGSMAKAAKHLAISQPVVSKVVADLEEVLGVRLFDRSPQGVEPTPYGRALLSAASRSSTTCEPGVDEIKFMADPTSGELRIGSTEPLLAGLGLAVMERLWRQYPRDRLSGGGGGQCDACQPRAARAPDRARAGAAARSSAAERPGDDDSLRGPPAGGGRRRKAAGPTGAGSRWRNWSTSPGVWRPRRSDR